MAFEVNTGTAASTLTGTEKLPVSQSSAARAATVNQLKAYIAVLASQAEAEAGTNNTKLMTPLRVAQAIAELAGGSPGVVYLEASGNTTSRAAEIQAALDSADVNEVVLGPGDFWLNALLTIPSNKTLRGVRGATFLKRATYALGGPGGNRVIVWASNAENVTVRDLVIDANRAGDDGVSADRCHGIEMRGLNFLIENVDIENVTGYATVANGQSTPVGGVIRNVRVWNANVCFEQIHDTSAGITLIDCYATSEPRDGGDQVSYGCESFLHQYGIASNITAIRFVGEGDVTVGAAFNPGLLANGTELENITLIDCRFTTTGEGTVALIGTPAVTTDRIRGLRMYGCKFSSPNRATGSGSAIHKVEDFIAVGCTFEGKNMALYVADDADGELVGCNCIALTDDTGAGVYALYSDADAENLAVTGGTYAASGGAANSAIFGEAMISTTTRMTPTQDIGGIGPLGGDGDSGGGVANGGTTGAAGYGFDATLYAVVVRAWGGGENGSDPAAIKVGTMTKDGSGFNVNLTNNGGNIQTVHYEWVAVPF